MGSFLKTEIQKEIQKEIQERNSRKKRNVQEV